MKFFSWLRASISSAANWFFENVLRTPLSWFGYAKTHDQVELANNTNDIKRLFENPSLEALEEFLAKPRNKKNMPTYVTVIDPNDPEAAPEQIYLRSGIYSSLLCNRINANDHEFTSQFFRIGLGLEEASPSLTAKCTELVGHLSIPANVAAYIKGTSSDLGSALTAFREYTIPNWGYDNYVSIKNTLRIIGNFIFAKAQATQADFAAGNISSKLIDISTSDGTKYEVIRQLIMDFDPQSVDYAATSAGNYLFPRDEQESFLQAIVTKVFSGTHYINDNRHNVQDYARFLISKRPEMVAELSRDQIANLFFYSVSMPDFELTKLLAQHAEPGQLGQLGDEARFTLGRYVQDGAEQSATTMQYFHRFYQSHQARFENMDPNNPEDRDLIAVMQMYMDLLAICKDRYATAPEINQMIIPEVFYISPDVMAKLVDDEVECNRAVDGKVETLEATCLKGAMLNQLTTNRIFSVSTASRYLDENIANASQTAVRSDGRILLADNIYTPNGLFNIFTTLLCRMLASVGFPEYQQQVARKQQLLPEVGAEYQQRHPEIVRQREVRNSWLTWEAHRVGAVAQGASQTAGEEAATQEVTAAVDVGVEPQASENPDEVARLAHIRQARLARLT